MTRSFDPAAARADILARIAAAAKASGRVTDDVTLVAVSNPIATLELDEVRRALAMLPDDQREVVLLRLEQELSLDEIGEITGVGRETVKSRLRYAMDKLRARLAP